MSSSPKVLILRGDSYKAVGEMFARHGYTPVYDVEKLSEVNLVVFTGGSDVSPYIYGEEPDGARNCDPVRDEFERDLYYTALEEGIPCVGICRGGQLLNVLNGGHMIQDLGMISGDVQMYDSETISWFEVRVDHHQGMISVEDQYGSIAISWYEEHKELPDYEIWYEDTKTLCVQYHPEWGHKPTEDRFFELIKEYLG